MRCPPKLVRDHFQGHPRYHPYPVEINGFFTERLSVLMRNGRGRRQRGNGRHGTALNGSRLNPGPTWDVGAVTKNGSRCQISECAVLLSDSAARRCVLSENTTVSFWDDRSGPLPHCAIMKKPFFVTGRGLNSLSYFFQHMGISLCRAFAIIRCGRMTSNFFTTSLLIFTELC